MTNSRSGELSRLPTAIVPRFQPASPAWKVEMRVSAPAQTPRSEAATAKAKAVRASCVTGLRWTGARLCSGAARPEGRSAVESGDALNRTGVAAPEDGRAPKQ